MLLTDMMPPKEKLEWAERAEMIWGAWEEGRGEGIKEGVKEGVKETAKAMKAKGIDINTIAEITGMTIEQIQQL